MNTFSWSLLLLVVVCVCLQKAICMPPMNVVASVRGKKIDIEAETVAEVSQEVEEKCGLGASEQSVLFRGKVLSPEEKLEDIGVAPGNYATATFATSIEIIDKCSNI